MIKIKNNILIYFIFYINNISFLTNEEDEEIHNQILSNEENKQISTEEQRNINSKKLNDNNNEERKSKQKNENITSENKIKDYNLIFNKIFNKKINKKNIWLIIILIFSGIVFLLIFLFYEKIKKKFTIYNIIYNIKNKFIQNTVNFDKNIEKSIYINIDDQNVFFKINNSKNFLKILPNFFNKNFGLLYQYKSNKLDVKKRKNLIFFFKDYKAVCMVFDNYKTYPSNNYNEDNSCYININCITNTKIHVFLENLLKECCEKN